MELTDRPLYIKKLMQYKDCSEIKILNGMRGVGKSSILKLFQQKLIESGISGNNIIYIDLETFNYCGLSDGTTLYDIAVDKIADSKTFLMIDEIRRLNNWQSAIVELKQKFDVDIYISNSGSSIVNDELCTKLNHQPIEIDVLPLSFKEYKQMQSNSNPSQSADDLFERYLNYGGVPLIHATKLPNLIKDVFYSAMAQDVFAVNKIADSHTMNLLIKTLFSEMGNIHSFNSLSKLLADDEGKVPSVRTVENYITMLTEAKLFYAVPIFDTKNNYSLTRYAKYYPVDLGFYSMTMGIDKLNTVKILESVVYFELLRLGVKVSNCKVGNKKVAFLAESEDNKIYIHVTDSIKDDTGNYDTKEIFEPLRSINDHYSKWILTLDKIYTHTDDGIRISNIIDFLLDE